MVFLVGFLLYACRRLGSVAGFGAVTMTEMNVGEEEEETCRLCWGGVDDGPLVQPCA